MRIRVRERGFGPSGRPPPGERRGTEVIGLARSSSPVLPVFVRRECMAGMLEHAEQGGEYEVGGFLVGGYHQHAGRRYVDITAHVPALRAISARTHLTFSNEAQRAFHTTLLEEHPDALVLGWYHTHPGYGVFLSGYDLFVQREFFDEEHHVALVIDPRQRGRLHQVGVFVWEGGDVSSGYHPIVYEAS